VPALLAAAGKFGAGRSELTPGMVDGVATTGDPARVLEHSLIYALIEIADAPGTAAGLASPNANARRAALIALDQMDGGGLKPKDVLPLRYSTERLLKQTALWIISHRSEWGDRLAAEYYGDLMFDTLPRPDPVETAAQLAQLAKSPAIQEILASLAPDQKVPAASRLIALRAMELAGLKETPPHWLDAIEVAFRNDDGDLARQAVATARTLTLPKKGAEKFLAVLQDGGRDPVLPADVRLNALAISGAPATVEPELFDFLVANVAPSKPLIVRGTAANVLAKAKLAPAQQLALADTAKSVSPLELPRLLPAFERGANEALGLKLVANLRDSAGVRGLRVDLVKPLVAKYPKSVQAAAEPLLNSLNADASKQAAHLDELVKQLPPGDLRRGQVVFVSAKAACTTCHAQGHLGGHLGPDLTNLGKVRTERDLLEAIVYPSASFVRSYEPFTVVTKGGDDFTGIIKKDAPDEVILAIGPLQEQRVARADITEMRPGTVSIMPAGLEDVLTRQELADLVTFLKSPAK
ncbi:MAG: dehydrogenase, partial [Verrucomicrobia bacterium]|nr:dehydrogenase [Verrucomicrobiota bacterium]